MKLLPVLWNNIKGLFFLIVTFIKICINPSGGEKAENARRASDEETPAQAISEQGPASTPGQGNERRILIVFVNINYSLQNNVFLYKFIHEISSLNLLLQVLMSTVKRMKKRWG